MEHKATQGYWRIFLSTLVFLLVVLFAPFSAQAKKDNTLTVGVAGSEPFVTHGTKGMTPTLWNIIVNNHNTNYNYNPIHYRLKEFDSIPELLESLNQGKIDVAIGPISVTSDRSLMKSYVFLQPWYNSSLAILTKEERSVWERIRPFLTNGFLYGLIIFALVIHIIGSIMWFLERKMNPGDFQPSWKGVFGGAWFAIVTMTTVGYGDKSPKSILGRIFSSVWMLASAVLYSSLTAFLASALLAGRAHPLGLESKAVVAVGGTTGAQHARERGARLRTEKSLREAVGALRGGHVEAVVHDAPMLRYWLKQNPGSGFTVLEGNKLTENYAFAVSWEVLDRFPCLNAEVLKTREEGTLERIESLWMSHS